MSTTLRGVRWLGALVVLASGALAQAGPWPKIEAAVTRWEGSRQMVLRTDLADPLSSDVVQALVEFLVEQGYTAVLAPVGAPATEGLVLDVRTAGGAVSVAATRAKDGAILAIERREVNPADRSGTSPAKSAPAAGSRPSESPADPSPPPPPSQMRRTAAAPALPVGPLELAGRPRGLAFLGSSAGEILDLALLTDESLQVVRVSGQGQTLLAEFRPPVSSTRALHVDAGDLDGDGVTEVAAVWAEDVRGVDTGTDSRLHSWILACADGKIRLRSDDLKSYVRIVGGRPYAQHRGAESAFAGPVLPLEEQGGHYAVGATPVPWAGRNLYVATPWSPNDAATWDPEDRLRLVELEAGAPLSSGLLLKNFGAFGGPEVAVRLSVPEFRSGFSQVDRVKEKLVALPRRVVQGADGSLYTIDRGYSKGLPLIGKASGRDALVRVVRRGEVLSADPSFGEVEAFLLDFSLVDEPSGVSAAILLLNDKEDGSGVGRLVVQQADGL